MIKVKNKTTSLDLCLRGTIGNFKIKHSNHESLEVKYILTHVALGKETSGHNDRLLKQLAPVREIFDIKQQEFDEVMQRDIDDARVSGELIPYILDSSATGTVKFFPPIVVMCLPVSDDGNRPADFYPEVFFGKSEGDDQCENGYEIIRSGDIGSEVFEFKQPISEGEPLNHDLCSLWINTSNSRLVIVDGQHRAMALLALYRNLKNEWSDEKRRAFRSYYSEWTPEYIRKFELDGIQLPIIVCTVPALDSKADTEYDLKKASRSIFLTLNKNAKPVSKTRNLLLDDNDMISYFMRSVLSKIKNGDDRSETLLDIHHVELDQDSDRQKINNPIAITAINHLYFIVEHLMLNNIEDIDGVSNRSGRYGARKTNENISPALTRLGCFDLLGSDATQTIRRDFFTNQQIQTLQEVFLSKYGQTILDMFQMFEVFQPHLSATEKLRRSVESHSDVHLKPMLFDGQGMIRTFEAHRENLSGKLKNEMKYYEQSVPKIKSISDSLESTVEALNNSVESFKDDRAKIFFGHLPQSQVIKDKALNPFLRRMCDEWFSNIFTSVAFQTAVVCTFITEIEKIYGLGGYEEDSIKLLFKDYLESLSSVLVPKSIPKLKALICLFLGRSQGNTIDELTAVVRNSPDTFRNVVYPGEMQPEAWPAYRYLFLEIWEKRISDEFEKSEELRKSIAEELDSTRKKIKHSLFERIKSTYMKDNILSSDDELHPDILTELKNKAIENYKSMLGNINKSSAIN